MDKSANPSTPSIAYANLRSVWGKIRAILSGPDAVKAAKEGYLIRFPSETDDEYKRRLAAAPWQPEFEDIIRGISSKPFSKEVVLAGEPSKEMKALAEDIDGRGNNLHVFAKDVFEGGVAMGAHGILVDFPSIDPKATLGAQQAANARPYWVSIDADDIISLRTERRGARDVVTHLRLLETVTVIEGFAERLEYRVRVIEEKQWSTYRQVEHNDDLEAAEWRLEATGPMTLGEVPFVFYATAERVGSQYVMPPMYGLANMQIELFNEASNEEAIYTVAGSPMLTANGMSKPDDGSAIETGPGRTLFAPGAENIPTSWAYIQPAAANMEAITKRRAGKADDMRRLGLQPLLPKTGNVTATASGIEAAKGHSATQTWANALKDALEWAFVFTAMWMKSKEEVEVTVHTDFTVGTFGIDEVKELREARANGDISQRTYWDELLRHGILGPQFDPDEEEKALLAEVPADDEEDIDASLGVDPNDPGQREAGQQPGGMPN